MQVGLGNAEQKQYCASVRTSQLTPVARQGNSPALQASALVCCMPQEPPWHDALASATVHPCKSQEPLVVQMPCFLRLRLPST